MAWKRETFGCLLQLVEWMVEKASWLVFLLLDVVIVLLLFHLFVGGFFCFFVWLLFFRLIWKLMCF